MATASILLLISVNEPICPLFSPLPLSSPSEIASEVPRVILAMRENRQLYGGAMGAVVEEEYKFTSVELEKHYNSLKQMLKSHGKELDASNDNELKALFASFKNTENKVVQTMKIMKKRNV